MSLSLKHLLMFTALNPEAAPAGGGAPAAPAATPAAPSATPNPPAAPAAAAPAPAATPASPSATPAAPAAQPERTIPYHRFEEVNNKVKTLEQQIKDRDAKMAAALGLTPSDPNSERMAQIRQAFIDVFPHLKPFVEMTQEQIDALVQTPQVAEQFKTAEQKQWERHSKQQMQTVYADVADAMGVEKLDEEAQQDVRNGFARWLRSKVQAEMQASNGQTSATLDRYEAGDPEVMREFSTAFTKRWADPARRAATAQAVTRIRPVPNSGGRTQVSSVQKPANFKSLDERLDYAANLYKERGGQFGR